MRKTIPTLFVILAATNFIYAQKHSLGLFVNAIHHVTHFDERSDFDEDVSVPYLKNVGNERGLVYNYRLKETKFRFHFGLFLKEMPSSIQRRTASSGRSRKSGDHHFAYQAGLGYNLQLKNAKNINFVFGYGMRQIRVPERRLSSLPIRFTPAECMEGCFRSFVKTTYQIRGNFHSSLFLKTEFEVWRNKHEKSNLTLNLIFNLGLQAFYQRNSVLYFTDGRLKEFLLNSRAAYYGIGLTYNRLSDTKFKDLFKLREGFFRW